MSKCATLLLTGQSSPKPVQFRERECSLKVLNVVLNIENEASVTTAVLYPSQTSTNHLKIEIWTVHWSRHNNSSCLWSIETFSEYTVIHKSFDLTAPELLYYTSPYRRFCLSAHGSRFDASRIQKGCHCFSMLDRCSKGLG